MTDEQRTYIREHFPYESSNVISEAIVVSPAGIRHYAARNGIKSSRGRYFVSTWTEEQNNTLRELYPMASATEVAMTIPHTPAAIRSQARRLGIMKSQSFKEEYTKRFSKNRKELIRKERLREAYGMTRKTKIILSDLPYRKAKQIVSARARLRKAGYIIERGSNTAYYDESTKRKPSSERFYQKRLTFLPLSQKGHDEVKVINQPPVEIFI